MTAQWVQHRLLTLSGKRRSDGQAQGEESDMRLPSKNLHKASNNQAVAATEIVSSPIFPKGKVVGGRGHV